MVEFQFQGVSIMEMIKYDQDSLEILESNICAMLEDWNDNKADDSQIRFIEFLIDSLSNLITVKFSNGGQVGWVGITLTIVEYDELLLAKTIFNNIVSQAVSLSINSPSGL